MSNQGYYNSPPGAPPNQQNQQYTSPPPQNQQYPPPNQQYGGNPNAQYSSPGQQYPSINQQQYPPNNQQYPANPNQQYSAPSSAPPGFHPPRRTDTEAGLPQGQERSEQVEHLQSFEAKTRQTEDDVNQATLQKEFPTIDSSLIAAIYGDSQSLSATREMLQALGSE